MAGVCHIQEAKCVKCNRPHLTAHHHHFIWCYKANNKINPLRLETKKGKHCPHTFKCLNCKDDHQANSNKCPFWKHCFNKEWHTKEYSKFRKIRKNLTHSAVNASEIWFWRIWKFFHKKFGKIISLSTWSSRLTISTSFSSRNHSRQYYNPFQALPIAKAID